MNKPKFHYDVNGTIVFFIHYKGIKVELLKVKMDSADLEAFNQYRNTAQANLNEFHSYMRQAEAFNEAA